MTVANLLAGAGREVTVFEAAPDLGGLASAWKVGELEWERHYHVVLPSDSHTLGLLAELDLQDELVWAEPKSALYSGGQFHPVSTALEFMRLPSLGLLDKLRLAATMALGSCVRDWRSLEDVPVEAWLRRWSGDRAFERFWLPLLRAKLGESYRDSSAVFLWASIQRLCATRSSGLARAAYGHVRGGYARVLHRFEERLRQRGVSLRVGSPITRITCDGRGLAVELANGTSESFDGVVVTAPAPVAGRLCEGLTAGERDRLAAIRYQGILCASVLLERPIHDCYLVYLADADLPFTAVVVQNGLVAPEELGGLTLVYLPRYLDAGHPMMSASDDCIRETFLTALGRLYPSLSANRVVAFKVSRAPNVFPVLTLGHSRRAPPMTTSVAGLYVVNSAQIVNATLHVNETLQLACRAAAPLLGAVEAAR
ncbi:MAG: FAD-dependent oxidoreductase [Candidatus Wallbacteria bacterium]|nr:FAD-dependent oxidoreductase [Candidatus Wallbacteria bacterium]